MNNYHTNYSEWFRLVCALPLCFLAGHSDVAATGNSLDVDGGSFNFVMLTLANNRSITPVFQPTSEKEFNTRHVFLSSKGVRRDGLGIDSSAPTRDDIEINVSDSPSDTENVDETSTLPEHLMLANKVWVAPDFYDAMVSSALALYT